MKLKPEQIQALFIYLFIYLFFQALISQLRWSIINSYLSPQLKYIWSFMYSYAKILTENNLIEFICLGWLQLDTANST